MDEPVDARPQQRAIGEPHDRGRTGPEALYHLKR